MEVSGTSPALAGIPGVSIGGLVVSSMGLLPCTTFCCVAAGGNQGEENLLGPMYGPKVTKARGSRTAAETGVREGRLGLFNVSKGIWDRWFHILIRIASG